MLSRDELRATVDSIAEDLDVFEPAAFVRA